MWEFTMELPYVGFRDHRTGMYLGTVLGGIGTVFEEIGTRNWSALYD
jgi:hypothetical protein